MGNFAARAGGRGNTNERQDRPGNVVESKISRRLAAMRQQNRDDLRQIHIAAAAQSQHAIRLEMPRRLGRDDGGMYRRLRFAAGKYLTNNSFSSQRFQNAIGQTRGDQSRIGYDKNAPQLVPADERSDLSNRAAAEDKLAGGVKVPGGTHRSRHYCVCRRPLVDESKALLDLRIGAGFGRRHTECACYFSISFLTSVATSPGLSWPRRCSITSGFTPSFPKWRVRLSQCFCRFLPCDR